MSIKKLFFIIIILGFALTIISTLISGKMVPTCMNPNAECKEYSPMGFPFKIFQYQAPSFGPIGGYGDYTPRAKSFLFDLLIWTAVSALLVFVVRRIKQRQSNKPRSRFSSHHIKPWQWVSVLAVVVIAVAGILIWQSFWQPAGPPQPPQKQPLTITTDKTEYEQGEAVRIVVKNGLNKSIQYYEGGARRDFPFTIEKLEDAEWKFVHVYSPCVCGLRCHRDDPDIMDMKPGQGVRGEWDQMVCGESHIKGELTDEGNYRARFVYFNPFDPEHRSKNKFAILSNEFRIK